LLTRKAPPSEPGTASGNDADRLLVEIAKEHGLPLITNEGYSMNGIVDEKLRKRAQDAGVQVFTPREFCQGKLDETEEISAFLQRFREQAVRYLEARQRELGPDKGYEVISLMGASTTRTRVETCAKPLKRAARTLRRRDIIGRRVEVG